MNTKYDILHVTELHGRSPKKTPLQKDVHLRARLMFAREHENMWIKTTYFGDRFCCEMKRRELFEVCLERKVRDQLSEKHQSHSEAWWCIDHVMGLFSSSGVGTLHRIEGIMGKRRL